MIETSGWIAGTAASRSPVKGHSMEAIVALWAGKSEPS
jgi:hypothetical protein